MSAGAHASETAPLQQLHGMWLQMYGTLLHAVLVQEWPALGSLPHQQQQDVLCAAQGICCANLLQAGLQDIF